jgi:DNA-binding transcriptional LysR family regulator
MFGGERVFYLSGFEAKKQALLMGLGFGWMPRHLADEELRAGTLREVRHVGGSRYRFTPLLVHRLDRPLGRTATRLIALLGGETGPATGPAVVAPPHKRRTGRRPP